MKHPLKTTLSLLLAALLLLAAALPAFAAAPFTDDVTVSVLTGSDFQDAGTAAYDRFGAVLRLMQADGLQTPHSMLVGGDYTKLLFDYATPGVELIRQQLTAAYPDADPDSVVCIQGNHDNPVAGFAKTGLSDMGAYALYVINEDDFPWLQTVRPDWCVKKVAADLKKALDGMIASGDRRPVLVMTHLPLHHTDRSLYGENRYASYIFDVLGDAGNTLDIVFLFGHQHSGDYDDYIGGSVNFMAPGDTIRVPNPGLPGANAYTERTLTFTYTNCGYIGYSNNTVSETSTNALSLGAVLFTPETLKIVKYGENGFLRADEVARKNAPTDAETLPAGTPARQNEDVWRVERGLIVRLIELVRKLAAFFKR